MKRITRKELETLATRLNDITGSPRETYTSRADGVLVANVGNFAISGAYGGFCLVRMVNESSEETCPLMQGHITARECHNQIIAYTRGIYDTKRGDV